MQVLLTGLVIMADWIASNPALFPYRTDTAFDQARIRSGLAELDLTAPWNAVVPEPGEHLLSARFGLPKHYRLRPVQRTALAEAAAAPGAGLMIIEAPMGEGKTEAALLAAETLAAKSGAGGCYIALPTRATSDAMFDRTLEWARRLPDRRVERGDHSIALAHAKAFANTRFTRLFHRGAASAVAQDEAGHGPDARLIAHWWMAGRKKTMFNSFVVGTIDQLLFAALKAKHLAMRHLDLAGKVVIIDEAHAYDVYMGVYFDTALEWLASYGVPVVILSATLPARRRCELVAAYEKGRNGPRPPAGRRRRPAPTPAELHPELLGDIGYPAVITAGTEGPVRITPVESSGRATAVEVRAIKDDPASLIGMLQRELDGGGCALVIRNTVKRVQQTAEDLRDAFGPKLVTVAHSRFAAPDRADKDELLRTLFGPPDNGHKRPATHIVVASQVAEQSLDIDFDLLVTDLAPADLVLQRMGRLHRHERPERTLPARCYLTGVDWDAETPEPVPGSVRVYGAWTLLRSAAVLHPYLDGGRMVILPGDIAPLVQTAYGTIDIGPESWLPAFAAAEAQAQAKRADQLHRAKTYRIQSPSAAGSPILGWLHGGDPSKTKNPPKAAPWSATSPPTPSKSSSSPATATTSRPCPGSNATAASPSRQPPAPTTTSRRPSRRPPSTCPSRCPRPTSSTHSNAATPGSTPGSPQGTSKGNSSSTSTPTPAPTSRASTSTTTDTTDCGCADCDPTLQPRQRPLDRGPTPRRIAPDGLPHRLHRQRRELQQCHRRPPDPSPPDPPPPPRDRPRGDRRPRRRRRVAPNVGVEAPPRRSRHRIPRHACRPV
nr:hypothetical protein GCM10025732_04210 [Glycomyces mayteni]